MAKNPPAKGPKKKSKYQPIKVDENESFFGESSNDEVFAPEARWEKVDLVQHAEKKKAAAAKRKKPKKPSTPRSEQEIKGTMWSSDDEPLRRQPQSVTVMPTPKSRTALIQTLPDGAVHAIQPKGGVEGLVISTADPEPDALSVDHTGMFSAPKSPKIRFGKGGGGGPKTPRSPAPIAPVTEPGPSSIVTVPEEVPLSAPAPVISVEPAKVTTVGPPEPQSLADARPGERGEVVIDPALVSAVNAGRRETFLWARKLKEKLFGSKESSEGEVETRKALVGLSSRFKNTFDIISHNQALFADLAKDNDEVRKLLGRVSDERIAKIVEKITKGEEVFPEENELLIENWEAILKQLEDIGVSLEANFGDLFKSAQATIADGRADLGTRRELVANIIRVADANKVQSEALEQLKDINLKQVNFTQDQTKQISGLLEQLEPSVRDIKIQGTLGEINGKMGAFLVDNRKFRELMESQEEGQKETLEEAIKKGLGALPEQMKGGILRAGLDMFGLGGLEDVLGDFGVSGGGLKKGGKAAGRGVGKVLSKIPLLNRIPGVGKLATWGAGAAGAAGAATKAPGLLGRIGGLLGGLGTKATPLLSTVASAATGNAISAPMAGKVMGKAGGLLKGGAKIAGKLAVPLAAGMAAWDTYQGFTNSEEVTGSKDNNLTQKTGAAVSSLISGLSFGLFDKKKVYEGISTLGNGVADTYNDLSEIVANDRITTMEKIKNAMQYFWEGITGFFSDATSWVADMIGLKRDGAGGKAPDDVDAIAKQQIKREEGLSLGKYKDAHGQSVGYGHFVKPGENIPETITKEDAERLFEEDYASIKDFVMQRLKVTLQPAQVASLLSYGYNAGPGAVGKVIDKLNAGDQDGAMETMRTTNKSRETKGGELKVNPGLVKRREKEVSQFIKAQTKATARINNEPVQMDARARAESKRELEAQRQSRNRPAQQAPMAIPTQSKPQSSGVARISGIDDPMLAMLNADFLGR